MQPQTAIPVAPKINTYLVPSILVTLFCCLPLGVAAIVFSAIAHGQVKSGNIEEALKNANIAKVLCWIGFGLGLAFIALYTIGLTLGGY
ncbi:MAG TPA: CD225/dispanin family protein [Proteobacteria bacterium]|nr:CD225/dispanin family protein [Pseudomonadota bacterium]